MSFHSLAIMEIDFELILDVFVGLEKEMDYERFIAIYGDEF